MSVQILSGEQGAAFYCTTTDWAFGPKMNSQEEAEAFLKWLPDDPRTYQDGDLQSSYSAFLEKNICESCTDLRGTECIECEYDGDDSDEPVSGYHKYQIRCTKEPEPAEGRFTCWYCIKAKKAA